MCKYIIMFLDRVVKLTEDYALLAYFDVFAVRTVHHSAKLRKILLAKLSAL